MGERLAFCRPLYFNNAPVFGHHHVHVRFSGRVLNVFQIANCFAVNNTDRNRGYHPFHRVGFQLAARNQLIQRICQCNACPGNRSGARAAISLEHVAVQRNGELTQRFQIYCRTKSTGDQTLDFHCASTLLTFRCFTSVTGVGRTWQHAVFCGDPALALTFQEARHAFFNRGGTQYFGIAKFDQHRAFCMFCIVTSQGNGTHLIIATACWTHIEISGLKQMWLRIIRTSGGYSYPDKASMAIILPPLLL